MKFNLVNKTKFAALIPCLLLMLAPAALAQTKNEQLETGQMYVHLDLAKLGQSQTGKIVVDSLLQIPYVKKQLDTIPDNLAFLTEANCETITLQISGDQHGEYVVMEIVGEFDTSKLFNLLSHGNGYAKVQYDGIDIHHWVTDLETLGNQFMGLEQSGKDSLDADASDSVYLAQPSGDRLLFSTSLARLTETLAASGRTLTTQSEQFDRFGDGNNLIALHIDAGGMDMPGELTAVVRESDSAKLQILAALDSRNDAEKQTAAMVASLLTNPKAATQMFAMTPNPNIEPKQGQSESGQPETQSAVLNLETAKDKPEHLNKLSLGFQLNSATLDPNDWQLTIERFLVDCVQCRHEGETLTLDINLFLGPCRVSNIAMDSEEGIARGQKVNEMNFMFNAYTTLEQREAAIRVAEKQTTESKRR